MVKADVIVGIFGNILSILTFLAPMSVLKGGEFAAFSELINGNVIRTRSVEYVPFFLSFFLFLNAGAWFTFAMLLKDFYLLVANAIGIVLGAAQLGIYMVYRKWSSPAAMEMDEDGGVKRDDPVENNDDEAHGKNKLGASIRNPSLSRQHSLKETMKRNEESHVEDGAMKLIQQDLENDGNKYQIGFGS